LGSLAEVHRHVSVGCTRVCRGIDDESTWVNVEAGLSRGKVCVINIPAKERSDEREE
jgi:hypothetical protein